MADQLTSEAIYDLCRRAGFTPDQSVTMTAVALAESGGNPGALAVASNEHSVGLWQINQLAHPTYTAEQLTDPLTNARAAYEVSNGGRDISPWTVTHRSGDDARYTVYEDEALAAARAHGDHDVRGYFAGVDGYADHHAADEAVELRADDARHPATEVFVKAALAQQGDSYRLGATPDANDDDPHTFDCSSLVQWAAERAGVTLERTAENQYLQLKRMGTTMSVEEALRTPGALLFHFAAEPTPGEALGGQAHVAISLGDGRTIEAVGTRWGVREVDVATFHTGGTSFFTNAAYVPGLADDAGGADTATAQPGDGDVPKHFSRFVADTGAEPATAASVPPVPRDELAQLGGLWRGTDSGVPAPAPAAELVLHALSGNDSGGHGGLAPLPPLGMQHGDDGLGSGSLTGLEPTPHITTGIPGLTPLPALAGASPDDDGSAPGLHGFDHDTSTTGGPGLQQLIETHHAVGDHDPIAEWASGHPLPGETALDEVAGGHELPGETLLHPLDAQPDFGDHGTIDDHHDALDDVQNVVDSSDTLDDHLHHGA